MFGVLLAMERVRWNGGHVKAFVATGDRFRTVTLRYSNRLYIWSYNLWQVLFPWVRGWCKSLK